MKIKFFRAVLIVCVMTALISLVMLGLNMYQSTKSKQEFHQLQQQRDDIQNENGNEVEQSKDSNTSKYKTIFEQNSDMIAWIEIENTSLSYPVMYTPDRPNYYLRRNFEGNQSDYGVPYLSEACPIDESDNLIIYGHNFKKGKMFGDLMRFKNKEFWDEHQIITLYTQDEIRKYRIFNVCKVTAFSPDVDVFPYYNFVKASNKQEYDNYLSSVKQFSLYDTGIAPSSYEQLITLSTCEYSQKNGRLIVVGYEETTE